jgi:hypothetical protein
MPTSTQPSCPKTGFQQSTAPAAETTDLRESVNVGPPRAAIVPAKAGPGAQPQEETMARPKRKAADEVVEIQKPDFDLAKRIYFNDIKPAQSKVGEHAQEMSTAYKEIKKAAHIQPQAAKLAFKLVEMEESKRDDFLRSLQRPAAGVPYLHPRVISSTRPRVSRATSFRSGNRRGPRWRPSPATTAISLATAMPRGAPG